ncbi:MAG: hypothetical protein FJW94_11000 [Actinobacteria bacterium]|nr:hypothetical protein [Actinomycetota bacterium]
MSAVGSDPPSAATGSTGALVGTIDSGVLAIVDTVGAIGAIAPVGERWTLDWWIGAEDRWHRLSTEVTTRQRLIEASPVVETAVRVPGGDVLARVGGVVASVGVGSAPSVLLEVENVSAVPVALALVVRPERVDGSGRVVSVRIIGSTLEIDGRVVLRFDRPIARAVIGRSVSDPGGSSVAERLADGDDSVPPVAGEDRDGRIEAAAVVALPHGVTVRALVGGMHGDSTDSWSAPGLSEVVAGWGTHVAGLASVELGGTEWTTAYRSAGSALLLAGTDMIAECLQRRRRESEDSGAARAAMVSAAAYRCGAHDLLAPVARALAGQQRIGGSCRLGDRSDGSVAMLWSAAGVLNGPAASAHVDELVAPIAVAVRRLRRGHGADAGVGTSAAAGALRAVVPGLLAAGQPEVAADAVSAAQDLVADVGASGSTSGGPVVPVGSRSFDAVAMVRFLTWASALAASDSPDGVDLLSEVSPEWLGIPIDVRGVWTAWGPVSWSLRWHGERPALLWEIEPAAGLGEDPVPSVRVPGLDPSWRGVGWSGEALLRPALVSVSDPDEDAGSGSFS